MRKFISVFLAWGLVIFCPSSNAASSVKPGIKCLKVDQVVIIGTKKYTCVRLKSKLTWDTGVVQLKKPFFTAKTIGSNFEWEVTVDNYTNNNNPNLVFSYFFAVDGGMWNEFSKTTATREKILVNQRFKLVEIMVAVSDRKSQYVISTKFERAFPETVIPPQSEVPKVTQNNSPSASSTPESPPVLRVDEPTLPTGFSVG
jgi:hypothetical protein